MKTIILFIAFATTSLIVSAQQSTRLSGKVISFEESFALEGVAVSVKGTNNFSGTQADGIFSISVKPGDTILVFSLPDYETKEVAITSNTDYDVILKRKGNDDNAKVLQTPYTNVPKSNTK